MRFAPPCLLGVMMISTMSAAAPWTLDVKRSELVVKTSKEGLASGLAHNHVIAATELSGALAFEPTEPTAATISVTVVASSLAVDEPALRARHGERSIISDADRAKVVENMKGASQLDVARFPTIGFVSTGLTPEPSGGFTLAGRLTVHGVTRPVSLHVTLGVEKGTLTGDGVLKFKTSEFGVAPYSAAFGAIRNADQVELVLHLVATRAE
jgi:polyisoprenoid-binding protein YceI